MYYNKENDDLEVNMNTILKIIKVTVILFFILLSVIFYNSKFNISGEVDDIEIKLSKYLNRDLKIQVIKKVENNILVSFSFNKEDEIYDGVTVLYQGLNSNYWIGDVFYNNRVSRINLENLNFLDKEQLVCFGYYENIEKIVIHSTVNENNYITIPVESNGYFLEISDINIKIASIKYFNIIDNSENIIIDNWENIVQNRIDYEGQIKSGPELIVFITSGLIVFSGYILSRLFAPKGTLGSLFRKWFYKGVDLDRCEYNDKRMGF